MACCSVACLITALFLQCSVVISFRGEGFNEGSGRDKLHIGRTVGVGQQAAAGRLLEDRFLLHSFLERHEPQPKPRPRLPDGNGKPAQQFPQSMAREFVGVGKQTSPQHLGEGHFGDVWKAFDRNLGKEVAVKIFYRKRSGEYLTWMTASEKEKKDLMSNVEECDLVKGLMANKPKFPTGAKRICQCHEERVSMKKNTNEVLFLVLELCGESLSKRRQKLKALDLRSRVAAARTLTKQVLQGIQFLQLHEPPLIHHDMKLDNVVVTGSIESPSVRLIDFGCSVWATPEHQTEPSTGDRRAFPPEFNKTSHAFSEPSYSFDVYGAGLIHMQLLCPSQPYHDWYRRGPLRPLSMKRARASLLHRCPELKDLIAEDLQLIEALTQHDPTRRISPEGAMQTACFSGL
eukprot:TRINITY_DN51436_c0_g1_i1.p1 TRINITY_DN51436_c0_g1~~TRINITY_DN51436_c0_g1_i1.p1  ORF type:complete len:403 (+),score=61.41 TRINITY_DN51436_c0_g1_i1:76-1284(+)